MRYKDTRGFTLIEVIVVAAIIAILAGILVPMIFNQIDESKATKAKGECDTYSKSMQAFRATTGFWPNRFSALPAAPDITLLHTTTGTLPADADLTAKGFAITQKQTFESVMTTDNSSYFDANGVNKWKQQMSETPADPWGNAYISNAIDLENRNVIVWVLSAGPNGILETNKTDTQPGGDDVGVKVVH